MNTNSDQALQILIRCAARAGLDDDERLRALERAVTAIEDSSLGTAAPRRLRNQAKPDDMGRIRERLASLQSPPCPAATPSASGTAARASRSEPGDGEEARALADRQRLSQAPSTPEQTNAYEVTLGPAGIRTVLSMPKDARAELAAALRTELLEGPNTKTSYERPTAAAELTIAVLPTAAAELTTEEFRFDSNLRAYATDAKPDGTVYTATALSFGGYTAIHRPLTGEELKRLRLEQGRLIAGQGFYVIDILLPGSAAGGRP